jgi:lysophospholipase L1-like esterase
VLTLLHARLDGGKIGRARFMCSGTTVQTIGKCFLASSNRLNIGLKVRLLSAIWWFAVILTSPLLFLLGLRTEKNTLRMPEAAGQNSGSVNIKTQSEVSPQKNSCLKDNPINLVFIGESPVAGVGVTNYKNSITSHTAQHLSKLTARTVNWAALGKNGVTIQQSIDHLVPKLNDQVIDYLVVLLGVNDVTGLTSLSQWNSSISQLITSVRKYTNAPISIYGCPPLGQFPALPSPLALAAGSRATLLDCVTKHHSLNTVEFKFYPFENALLDNQFALDGYHPSEQGCDALGQLIAVNLNRIQTEATA